MRIVVTGGAGFIGANFLNLLVPRHPEHTFINVDKLTYAGNPLSLQAISERSNYVFAHVDIADGEALDHVFEEHKPELVVHFAAESHVDRSILGPREFVRTNVEGTFTLLEAAREHFPKDGGLFHHVSTDEVYGSLGDEGFFLETTKYDPSSPYSASKAASDHRPRYLERVGQRLAIGLANVMWVLNLDCVVIGGGMAKADEILLGPLARTPRLTDGSLLHRAQLKIVHAHFGNEAGIIGAAALAVDECLPASS